MGDLACDSGSVLMEGHNISLICEDDTVLLEEALPPAGQTLCSCGELHQDGTHQQCTDGGSVETEVDISGCTSSEIKTGKEGDGNSQSHVASENSEQKESSSFEPSPSFLEAVREAVKHHQLKSGMSSGPFSEEPPTASKVSEEGEEQAETQEEEEVTWQNSSLHGAVRNPPVLQDRGPSSPDDIGDLEPEVVDCDTCGGQEPNCGSGTGFMREMLDEATSSHQASSYSLKMSFPPAEAFMKW